MTTEERVHDLEARLAVAMGAPEACQGQFALVRDKCPDTCIAKRGIDMIVDAVLANEPPESKRLRAIVEAAEEWDKAPEPRSAAEAKLERAIHGEE